MNMVWKIIDKFPDYEVSNKGKVRSKDRKSIYKYRGREVFRHIKGTVLQPSIAMGYERISLHCQGKSNESKIHKLVAQAFVDNPENKPFVNHKDGNKLNNCANNLEWVTRVENTLHAIENGLSCMKLDKFDYIHIRVLKEENVSNKEIANIFGITSGHVYKVVNNYTHL